MMAISCNAAASSEDDATISCISNGLYVGNYNSVSNVVVKKFNISSIIKVLKNIYDITQPNINFHNFIAISKYDDCIENNTIIDLL